MEKSTERMFFFVETFPNILIVLNAMMDFLFMVELFLGSKLAAHIFTNCLFFVIKRSNLWESTTIFLKQFWFKEGIQCDFLKEEFEAAVVRF